MDSNDDAEHQTATPRERCPKCGREFLIVTGPRSDPDAVNIQVVPSDYCEYEENGRGGAYIHAW